METGLYSISSIKNHLLSNVKGKSDFYLIYYVKEFGRSVWDEEGLTIIEFDLQRKAIPAYLKHEFVNRYGMGMQIPENNVLQFLKEYNININEEQIDDFIKRNYSQ